MNYFAGLFAWLHGLFAWLSYRKPIEGECGESTNEERVYCFNSPDVPSLDREEGAASTATVQDNSAVSPSAGAPKDGPSQDTTSLPVGHQSQKDVENSSTTSSKSSVDGALMRSTFDENGNNATLPEQATPPQTPTPPPRGFIIDGANALYYNSRDPDNVGCLKALISFIETKFQSSEWHVLCTSNCQRTVDNDGQLLAWKRQGKIMIMPPQKPGTDGPPDDDVVLLRFAAEHDLVVFSRDNYEKYLHEPYSVRMNDAVVEVIRNRCFGFVYTPDLGIEVMNDAYGPGRPMLQGVVERKENDYLAPGPRGKPKGATRAVPAERTTPESLQEAAGCLSKKPPTQQGADE